MKSHKNNKSEISKIAYKFGLSLVVQFGSSLEKNGIKHSESDIDIAFLPNSNDFTLKQLIGLQYDLAVLYGVFENKIDLVDLKKCNSLISYHIAGKGKVLYDRDGHQFNQFYINSIRQKIDEADLYQLQDEVLNKKVRSYV